MGVWQLYKPGCLLNKSGGSIFYIPVPHYLLSTVLEAGICREEKGGTVFEELRWLRFEVRFVSCAGVATLQRQRCLSQLLLRETSDTPKAG